MKRKIYLASSWRNAEQPFYVSILRAAGHEVYDFRNPPGQTGFSWKEVDYGYEPGDAVNMGAYINALRHPRAVEGFRSDFDAMKWADTFVLLLPCGRSAHLEAGWATGQGKDTYIMLHEDKFEPELMYLLAGQANILTKGSELIERLRRDS